MKRAKVKYKTKTSSKSKRRSGFGSPLRLFLILWLSFGISTVGRAAEKIKRGFKTKRNNLRSSYAALLNAKAWAYFHPAWHKASSPELTPALEAADHILGDPDNRIEKGFKIPSALRGRVAFWIDIYARFSSEYRVVHDKDNPELIYGYMDFRSLYRSMPRRMAHARAHQIEERILNELKGRIAEAMEVSKPKTPTLTAEEKTEIHDLLGSQGIRTAADAMKPIRRVRAQTGQKEHFLKGISRSSRLITEIEAIFKEHNLPLALARLPFVESAYNRGAVSKVGAIGMWQFLPETARRFAPSSTWAQLSDPMRQSKSAARMFTILHSKFEDWGLAVTAYNSGALRVKRIADANRLSDVEKLLRVPIGRGNLGFAGNNFYCEFLAAVYVENYKDKIFSPSEVHLARVDLPRRLQSLLSGSQTAVPHIPTPVKVVEDHTKNKPVVRKHAKKKIAHHAKPKSRVVRLHPKKSTPLAYRHRATSRRSGRKA